MKSIQEIRSELGFFTVLLSRIRIRQQNSRNPQIEEVFAVSYEKKIKRLKDELEKAIRTSQFDRRGAKTKNPNDRTGGN